MVQSPVLSVHIPKTAGTSFQNLLFKEYGSALHVLYKKPRPNSEICQYDGKSGVEELRQVGVEVLHGHVRPAEYAISRQMPIITWVREPLQRCRSHYLYWHRRKIEFVRDLSFDAFIEHPRMRNFMAGYLQADWPIRLAAVGVVEAYDESLKLIGDQLGRKLTPLDAAANHNPERSSDAVDYSFSADLANRFRALNQADYRLYESALMALEKGEPPRLPAGL